MQRLWIAALGVMALTLTCQDERRGRVTAPAVAQRSDTVFFLSVSDPRPAAGSTVTVTANVARRSAFKPVAGFKAHLRYDPTGLTFLRESTLPNGVRAFNPQRGHLIAAGAAAAGFEDGRLFAATFRVQNPGALHSLALDVEELNGTDFADQLPAVRRGALRVTAPNR